MPVELALDIVDRQGTPKEGERTLSMESLYKPDARSRGLVLAGGGAKGAFAFGCLQAFRREGIEFSAVAGTSVGALNALLWATNSMREGEKIWEGHPLEATVQPTRKAIGSSIPRHCRSPQNSTFATWPLPNTSDQPPNSRARGRDGDLGSLDIALSVETRREGRLSLAVLPI